MPSLAKSTFPPPSPSPTLADFPSFSLASLGYSQAFTGLLPQRSTDYQPSPPSTPSGTSQLVQRQTRPRRRSSVISLPSSSVTSPNTHSHSHNGTPSSEQPPLPPLPSTAAHPPSSLSASLGGYFRVTVNVLSSSLASSASTSTSKGGKGSPNAAGTPSSANRRALRGDPGLREQSTPQQQDVFFDTPKGFRERRNFRGAVGPLIPISTEITASPAASIRSTTRSKRSATLASSKSAARRSLPAGTSMQMTPPPPLPLHHMPSPPPPRAPPPTSRLPDLPMQSLSANASPSTLSSLAAGAQTQSPGRDAALSPEEREKRRRARGREEALRALEGRR